MANEGGKTVEGTRTVADDVEVHMPGFIRACGSLRHAYGKILWLLDQDDVREAQNPEFQVLTGQMRADAEDKMQILQAHVNKYITPEVIAGIRARVYELAKAVSELMTSTKDRNWENALICAERIGSQLEDLENELYEKGFYNLLDMVRRDIDAAKEAAKTFEERLLNEDYPSISEISVLSTSALLGDRIEADLNRRE